MLQIRICWNLHQNIEENSSKDGDQSYKSLMEYGCQN
jgi:hypothetical protein